MNPVIAHRSAKLAAILLAAMVPAMSACASHGTPPPPVPGGKIATLVMGHYTCELPGDASGPSANPVPEFEFRVVNASSYKSGGVRGSYLYTGDRVIMTGGKLTGLKLHRISNGFLRQILDDGSDGEMRCVRISRR